MVGYVDHVELNWIGIRAEGNELKERKANCYGKQPQKKSAAQEHLWTNEKRVDIKVANVVATTKLGNQLRSSVYYFQTRTNARRQ
jgi:hypothetical protein